MTEVCDSSVTEASGLRRAEAKVEAEAESKNAGGPKGFGGVGHGRDWAEEAGEKAADARSRGALK